MAQKRVKYSIDDIIIWAEIIECREDIGYEEKYYDEIKDIIECLSNVDLYGPIGEAQIHKWLSSLKE